MQKQKIQSAVHDCLESGYTAIQCNPIFKATYARLLEAGKLNKAAIITCIHKMVPP